MKKIILLILIILISLYSYGKVAAAFEEVSKPQMMAVSGDYLLITEGSTIFIYSTKDFSFIKKFGKPGEGPREFKISPFGPPMIAYFYEGNIFVSSDSKVSYFTPRGEFIKEIRVPPFSVFRPFKEVFVATGSAVNDDKQTVLTINLHNSKMEKLKELYKSDMSIGPNASFSYPINQFSYEPYGDKLFLVRGKDGFVIDVLSISGEKLYTIKKDFEKIKVTQDYKDKTIKSFKTDPNFKQFFEFFKQRIKFKQHYPAIQDLRVTNDRIHVITFKKKGSETECIILDLKGKELKRVYVPYPELHGMDYMPEYDIYKSTFYILIENEDEETWELHTKKL